MGFVGIFLKEQCPRGLLAKYGHFGANCLSDLSPVILRKLHANPSKFFLGKPKKNLEGFFVEFFKHNWATISETICPQNAHFW